MNKIKNKLLNCLFKTRYGRNVLASFLIIFGIIGVSIGFPTGNKSTISVLLFIVGVAFIEIGLVLLVIDYKYSRKVSGLRIAHLDLYNWIKYNNIGNATNIVKSLANEQDIMDYFKKRREIILNEHEKKYKLNWVDLDKNSFLVETIRELITQLDAPTRQDLFFLEKYLDYDVPSMSFQDKFLNGVFSVTAIAGYLASFKFSFEVLINGIENKNNIIIHIGITLVVTLIIVLIILGLIIKRVKNKREIERNSKNFLDLLFRILKENKNEECT